jgi:hypothetical protein
VLQYGSRANSAVDMNGKSEMWTTDDALLWCEFSLFLKRI